ncbi:2-dehydropantoate 2-reductase [Pseudonocardia oceani]|uniref:2-dehydropantoate 2-reductase n=4 Tax=Pseudonocardia oceani TaxID=2792013 RepID=A0ABS6U4K1_9PSEU|nr:2-dehydropantoate 2-reductase [Pseudonocardia oceani]MBW0127149.1 2-dehydropantoate 2-reductase [Pseudonocardia oceani]
MRVAVVGVGAVGGVLAVALAEAGHEVLGCRSPASVTLTDDDRGVRTRALTALADPADAEPVPFVVLATKIHQSATAAPWLDALAGPDTVVVAAQNGIDHAERVPPALRGRVAPALVYVNAERTGPGQVRARRTERELVLADDGPGRAAAGLFASTWLRVEAVADFRTAAWRKLLTNVVVNPITALTARRVEVLREPAVAELALAALREAVAVGRAEGADLPDGAAGEALRWLQGLPAGATTSMLQDRLAGRALEVDGLTGAVVRLAARHGVDAPASRALLALTAAAAVG